MLKNIIISNKSEMSLLAKRVASQIENLDVIAIDGNLGAGKTFFTSELIKNLSTEELDITSPTFSIVKTYDVKDMQISHFDLYRIKNENELRNIDLEEFINAGLCIIEWPDIAKNIICNYNTMYIDIKINNSIREVKIKNER